MRLVKQSNLIPPKGRVISIVKALLGYARANPSEQAPHAAKSLEDFLAESLHTLDHTTPLKSFYSNLLVGLWMRHMEMEDGVAPQGHFLPNPAKAEIMAAYHAIYEHINK